jgi:hypothetical protein
VFRIDLKAAGIPYQTNAGVVDFHALRAVYISNLVSSGASVKTCQVLAKHSTPSLTIGVYAKASLHDVKGAVEALPDLTRPGPDREALAATGTDGVSAPDATYSATLQPDDVTQPQARRLLAVGSATDLGSYAARREGSSPSSRNDRKGGPSPTPIRGVRLVQSCRSSTRLGRPPSPALNSVGRSLPAPPLQIVRVSPLSR